METPSPFTIDLTAPGNVYCSYCKKSLKMTTSAAHLKSAAHIRLAGSPEPRTPDATPESQTTTPETHHAKKGRAGKTAK